MRQRRRLSSGFVDIVATTYEDDDDGHEGAEESAEESESEEDLEFGRAIVDRTMVDDGDVDAAFESLRRRPMARAALNLLSVDRSRFAHDLPPHSVPTVIQTQPSLPYIEDYTLFCLHVQVSMSSALSQCNSNYRTRRVESSILSSSSCSRQTKGLTLALGRCSLYRKPKVAFTLRPLTWNVFDI